MRVLFFSNIPSPYRIDFYNCLGKYVDLTVVFEARRARNIQFNWNDDQDLNFQAVFLSEGEIKEKTINFRVFKYLYCKRFDYVFITNYGYITELICALFFALTRQTYYLELDGAVMREKEPKLKYFLKRLVISRAKKTFSPSALVDEFLAYYGATKNQIVRYPFSSLKERQILKHPPSELEKIQFRKQLMISENKVVLAVGQFIHRKGFDLLLEAASTLPDDIGFYFVGGIPTEEYLQYVSSRNMRNVHFVGFQSEEKLREYYLAADLFCLPTREDVWGLVINEAMACGLPVVTTNKCCAGIELIENETNGILIPINNESLLAEKIMYILNNQDIKAHMAKSNLEKIKGYTIEEMVNEHLNIMEKVEYKYN